MMIMRLPNCRSFFWRMLVGSCLLIQASLGFTQGGGEGESAAASPLRTDTIQLFRSIFYEELAADYDRSVIETLILHPTSELQSPFAILDHEQPFAELDRRLAGVSPKDLYEEGLKHGFSYARSSAQVSKPATEVAPREAATIVLATGIANELVVAPPFAGVLSQASSFKSEWQELLASLAPAQRRIKIYNWNEFREVEVDIGDVFQAGSIDGPEGRPYVRYLFVVPAYGSLETVGSLDFMAAALERRLEQVFAIMPEQRNIYLAGYSQGANVVVNLAARQGAKKQPDAWFRNVKGVLSIGGPLFGSQLASIASTPGNPIYEILAALEELRTSLQDDYQSVFEIPALMVGNALLWQSAMGKVMAARERYNALHQSIASEAGQAPPLTMLSMLKTLGSTAFGHSQKSAPAWQYFGHIKRLKIMLGKTLEAARAMSHGERRKWWQTHELPATLRYLTVAGVMPSARDRFNDDPLVSAPGAGVDTLDYTFLRSTFYDIFWTTGIDLNDSQVSLRDAFFWPAVHQVLNPRQPPYEAHNLGILATHHWGLGLPGSMVPEGPYANRFPRAALLKSIGLTILALDEALAL